VSVRVIAGRSKGRTLRAPPGPVRPTSDRVREAIFDVLGSLLDFEGISVVDLFAGTGAMGIEALSRGASSVVFVERDRLALESVRKNLVSVGLLDPENARRRLSAGGSAGVEAQGGGSVELVRAEVLQWLEARAWEGVSGSAGTSEARSHDAGATEATTGLVGSPGTSRLFDLALVDPPYAFDQWPRLLHLLETQVAVLESNRPIEVPARFDVTRTKHYGGTLVTVIRASGTSAR
jgi:16S rRNA (guanine966-N2)-methyltransferase